MRIDKNTTIKLGDKNIVRIKIGDSVIWEKKTVVDADYFYIESLGDGNTVSVKNKGDGNTSGVTPTLEYSTDKNTWNTITFNWASGNHTTELPVKLNTGEKMYFRNDTRLFSNTHNKYITFSSSVSSNVGGDIRTLSNYLDVDSETTTQSYMFYYLFYNNKNIVDASNLRLPYTTLASSCYSCMFYGCTSLTTAPTELPATTLANYCYSWMFHGCTSLTTAPTELPATTLAENCYYRMFYDCTSLTTAPTELPATTLPKNCYKEMFRGCTSLVNAPELPATTLEYSCYFSMFFGCTSLVNAPQLPATKLAYTCYSYMFYNCTSLVNAPELPATNLVNNCYDYMFYGCTSLVNAPQLPATYLTGECYLNMFANCSSLNSITVYADNINANRCTSGWLSGVASTGTFRNLGSATYTKDSVSGIPVGWVEVKE